MKIINLLEALSSVLFHTTSLKNALSILQNDKFLLTPVIENDIEHNIDGSHNYFMSFSRTKTNGFTVGMVNASVLPVVTFIINGDILSNNYAGTPVKYSQNHANELEDRLVTNRPSINNASKYIKSINVLVNNHSKSSIQGIIALQSIAKSNQLPINFYNNPNDFVLLSNPVQLNTTINDNDRDVRSDLKDDGTNSTNSSDYSDLIQLLSSTPNELDNNSTTFLAYLSDPIARGRTKANILKYLNSIKTSDRETINQYFSILKNSGSKNIDELFNKVIKAYG